VGILRVEEYRIDSIISAGNYFSRKTFFAVLKGFNVAILMTIQFSHGRPIHFSRRGIDFNLTSHDIDFDLTFFTIFRFFLLYFGSKNGPNSPKVCQKCKILTKWYFGT
jgi:hypothetical protein